MIRRSLLTLAAASLVLAACGQGAAKKADANAPLVVGATAVPHAEILEHIKPLLAAVLERGGRVVSNMFKVPGWEHKTQRVARGCSIYLYGR